MIYPWAVLFINLSLAVVLNKYLNLNISILIPILVIILSFVFNGIIRFLVLNLAIFLLGISISYKEKPILQTNQPIFVECVVSSFPDYSRFGSKFDCKVINSSEKQLIGKTFPVFAKYEENIYFLSRIAFLGKAKEKDGNLILMPTRFFLKVDNSDNFLYPILKYRENCISNYRQNAISYETFQVGSALIFGENRYLDLQAKKPFYQTGLAHLIAISGSHIAIL
ncbi:MAG: ComEC/Rec2 family competence protein, partial [Sulfurihydrogenibium sp.]|nr:ComEC/Rec2 family competence protein [Sulfurihydrogenibium sp.]